MRIVVCEKCKKRFDASDKNIDIAIIDGLFYHLDCWKELEKECEQDV